MPKLIHGTHTTSAVEQTELDDIRNLNARVDAMQARLVSNIERAKGVQECCCVHSLFLSAGCSLCLAFCSVVLCAQILQLSSEAILCDSFHLHIARAILQARQSRQKSASFSSSPPIEHPAPPLPLLKSQKTEDTDPQKIFSDPDL